MTLFSGFTTWNIWTERFSTHDYFHWITTFLCDMTAKLFSCNIRLTLWIYGKLWFDYFWITSQLYPLSKNAPSFHHNMTFPSLQLQLFSPNITVFPSSISTIFTLMQLVLPTLTIFSLELVFFFIIFQHYNFSPIKLSLLLCNIFYLTHYNYFVLQYNFFSHYILTVFA